LQIRLQLLIKYFTNKIRGILLQNMVPTFPHIQ